MIAHMLLMILQYCKVYSGARLGVGVKNDTCFARFVPVWE